MAVVCQAIDPRILQCWGGARWIFTDQVEFCLQQARNAVICSVSRMKGELRPTRNRLWGGLRHLMRTFMHMDDSIERVFFGRVPVAGKPPPVRRPVIASCRQGEGANGVSRVRDGLTPSVT